MNMNHLRTINDYYQYDTPEPQLLRTQSKFGPTLRGSDIRPSVVPNSNPKYEQFRLPAPQRASSLLERYKERSKSRLRETSFDLRVGKGVDFVDTLTESNRCYVMPNAKSNIVTHRKNNSCMLLEPLVRGEDSPKVELK